MPHKYPAQKKQTFRFDDDKSQTNPALPSYHALLDHHHVIHIVTML